ncbi:Hypothetical predicted protein [Marmota monax]|uniref:Uncharacterized protein n=1 Tax=Marmota monax TaxID=9995 RepID=A0A5E4D0U0_MARMO|nr:hypothetical protein GHT09_011141 [Marmota monax]VTJ86831.1 Hypothetical predicted protein [Marmota monax]
MRDPQPRSHGHWDRRHPRCPQGGVVSLSARTGEEIELQLEERSLGRHSVLPPGLEEESSLGTGSSPGDGGVCSPSTSSLALDQESPVGRGSACRDISAETREDLEGLVGETSDPAMSGPGRRARNICVFLCSVTRMKNP